jgi:cobalt-precorrin-5B (C1)-methyltransferase
MVEMEPEGEHLRRAFEKTAEKAKGARVVIVERDGTVLMDSGDKK